MKTQIISFFFLLAILAYCDGQATSVSIGNPRPGEVLVYDRTIIEPAVRNSIVGHTVVLSDTSILITRVIVRPTNPRITAFVIVRGGPGRNSVIIILRSRRGAPILYRIRIYAIRFPSIIAARPTTLVTGSTVTPTSPIVTSPEESTSPEGSASPEESPSPSPTSPTPIIIV